MLQEVALPPVPSASLFFWFLGAGYGAFFIVYELSFVGFWCVCVAGAAGGGATTRARCVSHSLKFIIALFKVFLEILGVLVGDGTDGCESAPDVCKLSACLCVVCLVFCTAVHLRRQYGLVPD